MFRGTFQHAIDAKGRTSLPSKFREVLASRSEEQLVVTQGPDKCLWCLPPSAWSKIEERVREKSQWDPTIRKFVHAFVAPAQDCSFDKMGRILVPPNLREFAGLEGDVVWMGAIDRIELWSLERWKKRHEETTAALDDGALMQSLSNLGV